MADTVKLLALGLATPEHILWQDKVAEAARALFAERYAAFDRLAAVFTGAGIRKRHAARPLDWFVEPHGWPDRTAAYLDAARLLYVAAARRALDAAGLAADAIDTVVTLSSTGIATPSLEAQVARDLGLRPETRRVPVFGLGCAGGVTGLALAADLARARPGRPVLFVALELCTLAFRLDALTKANIVATALFGDGAAACVLCAGPDGLAEIEAQGEHLWPDTLDIMGWSVDRDGLGVIFAQAIPSFAEAHLGPAVRAILGRDGIGMADVDRFICHPGGPKVVAALERALSLEDGSLDHERAVMADYGNMSSPTVLFVLDRVIRAGLPNRAVLTAMGPGFTAGCVTLRRAA